MLIDKVCSTRKPLILSTGASSLEEIELTVMRILKNGYEYKEITLLHCVLNYPTEKQNANLMGISLLKSRFPNIEIGL